MPKIIITLGNSIVSHSWGSVPLTRVSSPANMWLRFGHVIDLMGMTAHFAPLFPINIPSFSFLLRYKNFYCFHLRLSGVFFLPSFLCIFLLFFIPSPPDLSHVNRSLGSVSHTGCPGVRSFLRSHRHS